MASSEPDPRLLFLLRHGKADGAFGGSDASRELTDKGWAQARLIGEYLQSQKVWPTRVLVSTAQRTRQTWEGVREAMPGFDGKVTHHEDIYTGGPKELLELIRGVKDKHPTVMVIGHEPTMATISSLLADDDSDPGAIAQARIGMPTGGMGVLSAPLPRWKDVDESGMTLHTIVRP